MSILADLLLLIGSLFMFLGGLGLLRMPDVYTRIQAGTKAVTLGSMALLIGVALHRPEWWPKLLLIALFVLLTSPLGSSAIARAARIGGVKPLEGAEARVGDSSGRDLS